MSMLGLKKKIINSFQEKDNKVLLYNFVYLSLMQIAGFVFPLLTLPYLAKVVGTAGFGKVAFASAIIIWVQTISDWGFNYTATRNLALSRDDPDAVSHIFSTIFWSRIVLTCCSLLLLLLLIFLVPKFRENCNVILVTFLMVPGNVLVSEWFFQALERMKYITILNLLAKFLFMSCVFLFVKEKNDYILQPFFISLGFIVSGCIAMYFILIRWKVKLQKSSFSEIYTTIKDSTDVFINNLMPNLYNSMSTVLLGFYSTATSVGIYSAGKNFISVSNSMISVISRAFYPYLARKTDKHTIFAKINIGVALIVVSFLFSFAPFIIHIFYTDGFSDSIVVLRITSISLIFIVLNTVYGTNYLLLHNCDRLLRNITIISSVVGLILAFPLIVELDYIGASLTFLISNILMGVFPTYYALRMKKCDIKR